MTVRKEAGEQIARISLGLPHYTHLVSLNSAISAIAHKRLVITEADVNEALYSSIDGAMQTVTSAYHAATTTHRPSHLYKQVLLACALADVDDLGYFAPADVAAPMSEIMHKPYDVPNFIRHLHAFCEPERGSALQMTGTERRRRFRFTDPLLSPYVIMRGWRSGWVTKELMDR